jgi:hypothetical protein
MEGKTIVSFDLGVRNMAYCIMKYIPENIDGDRYCIHNKQWGIINLMVDEPDIVCKSLTKKGTVCGKKVSLYKLIKKERHYYCKIHSRGLKTLKNFKQKKKGVKDISYNVLFQRLFIELDKIPDLLDVDKVVLENQPICAFLNKNSMINNIRTKLLSSAVRSYFIIRGKIDKGCIEDILEVNASQSLNLYDGPCIDLDIKNKYKLKKTLAIKHCEYIIRENKENLKIIESYKKKDDLADAFLNGAQYLYKNRSLPQTKIKPFKIIQK